MRDVGLVRESLITSEYLQSIMQGIAWIICIIRKDLTACAGLYRFDEI